MSSSDVKVDDVLVRTIYAQLCALISTLLEIRPGVFYGSNINLSTEERALNFSQFVVKELPIKKTTYAMSTSSEKGSQMYEIGHKHISLNPIFTATHNIHEIFSLVEREKISDIPGVLNMEIDFLTKLRKTFEKNKFNLSNFYLASSLDQTNHTDLLSIYNLSAYLFTSIAYLAFFQNEDNLYLSLIQHIYHYTTSDPKNKILFDFYTLISNCNTQIPSTYYVTLTYGLAFSILPTITNPSTKYKLIFNTCIKKLESHLHALQSLLYELISILKSQNISCGEVSDNHDPFAPQPPSLFYAAKINTLDLHFSSTNFTFKTLSLYDIFQLFYIYPFHRRPDNTTTSMLFHLETNAFNISPTSNILAMNRKEDGRYFLDFVSSNSNDSRRKLIFEIQFALLISALKRSIITLNLTYPIKKIIQFTSLIFPFALKVKPDPAIFTLVSNTAIQIFKPVDCSVKSAEMFHSHFKYSPSKENILGTGNYSIVYKGSISESRQEVAIKVSLKLILPKDCVFISQLNHPNIVKMYGVYKVDDKYIQPMELFNVDLLEAMKSRNGKRFNEIQSLNIFHQLTSAVLCCHRHGICHRDIKPNNILSRGNPLSEEVFSIAITDFGSARMVSSAYQLLPIEEGTSMFMPPEAISEGALIPIFNHDAWALGLSMLFINSGLRMYAAGPKTLTEIRSTVANGVLNPDAFTALDPKIRTILTKMLKFKPEDRISLKEVNTMLERFLVN